ncbi:MAG: hypothetical protein J5846_06185 [Desulfovibrio sp.]|nr:hypothetical protein [Desulfovibrio sp.]
MHKALFSLISTLLLMLVMLPTEQALGKSLMITEQLCIPEGLTDNIAQDALRARIWLDGIQKLQNSYASQHDLSLHFATTSYPALALLLNSIDVTFEQRGNNTVTAIFSATPRQTVQELLARSTCFDLLHAAEHLVLATEKTLQSMDQHWPKGRLYTADLGHNAQSQTKPEKDTWTEEDWLAAAHSLEAFWLGVQALDATSDDWLTNAQELEHLEKAVSWQAADPCLLSLLAEARLLHDLPQLCVETATRALAQAADLPRTRYLRALAHWQLQQLGLAENDLSVILQAPASEPVTLLPYYRARGAVRLLLGRFPGMCEDFTQACSLGDCDGLKHARSLMHCLPQDE